MDPVYEKALELVKGERSVTVSWLQRELDIGFSRAARLVEAMEKEGVVGPALGAQGREVLGVLS